MTHAVSVPLSRSDNEIDDINDYIATMTQEERDGLIVAQAALDLATLLDRARMRHDSTSDAPDKAPNLGTSAYEAIERAGVAQPLRAFRRYLRVLGYEMELNVVDAESGAPAIRVVLPPSEDAP